MREKHTISSGSKAPLCFTSALGTWWAPHSLQTSRGSRRFGNAYGLLQIFPGEAPGEWLQAILRTQVVWAGGWFFPTILTNGSFPFRTHSTFCPGCGGHKT